jgi:hypothetical protein
MIDAQDKSNLDLTVSMNRKRVLVMKDQEE